MYCFDNANDFICYLFYSNVSNVEASVTKGVRFNIDNLINEELVHKKLNNINGNGYDIYTQEYLDQYFSGLDGSELILELPGGGFLGGPADAVFEVGVGEGNIKTYCIGTDPNSETVAEAKARLLNQPMKYEWVIIWELIKVIL